MEFQFAECGADVWEIQRLLSYAVGPSSKKRLNDVVRYYGQGYGTIYVLKDVAHYYGVIGFRRLNPQSVEILHIAVDERHRYQGIGRRLIDDLLMYENLTSLVAETDEEAVGFYKSVGFTVDSLGEKYPGVERFLCKYIVGR